MGGIYSHSERQRRSGGASYTKSASILETCEGVPSTPLTLKGNTLPFYRSSKRRVPYGVYIFSTLASSKSLKCVRSLTSFSVRSIVAVIFSEFARSSSGNFSRFAHASSKFLGFVSTSMCIILYISRGSLEVRLHFSTVHRLLNADLLAIVNTQLRV